MDKNGDAVVSGVQQTEDTLGNENGNIGGVGVSGRGMELIVDLSVS